MAVVVPHEGILKLIGAATRRVVVAAPYIKSPTLRRLLAAAPATVSEFVCITRWLPEDIASGVCDLEIFEDLERVPGGRLLVHPQLHAKYYSNSRESLVGSANLTARGLGRHTPSNLELLVSLPSEFPGLKDWEDALLRSAVPATRTLRDQLRTQAIELKQGKPILRAPEVEDTPEEEHGALWIPQCPTPERLWEVYRGRGGASMVSSAFEAAQKDLAELSPPRGLTDEMFTAYVAAILKHMPLFVAIDNLASYGLPDLKAQEFLADPRGGRILEGNYEQLWGVLKLWLLHFFPTTYRIEASQEVLVKARELPRR